MIWNLKFLCLGGIYVDSWNHWFSVFKKITGKFGRSLPVFWGENPTFWFQHVLGRAYRESRGADTVHWNQHMLGMGCWCPGTGQWICLSRLIQMFSTTCQELGIKRLGRWSWNWMRKQMFKVSRPRKLRFFCDRFLQLISCQSQPGNPGQHRTSWLGSWDFALDLECLTAFGSRVSPRSGRYTSLVR